MWVPGGKAGLGQHRRRWVARLAGALLWLVLGCGPGSEIGSIAPGSGSGADSLPEATGLAPPAAALPAEPTASQPAGEPIPPPVPLPGLRFDRYHTLAEISAYLAAVAAARPALVRVEVLGRTAAGREIPCLVLDATGQASAPAVLLLGTHHGDEKPSTEAILALIGKLLSAPAAPEVSPVLSSLAVYFVPVVNPDGHAEDTRGVPGGADPNRDYATPGRAAAASFQLAETQAIQALHERIRFRAALAYHAGMLAVLWPWCHSSKKTADQDLFYTLAKRTAEAMGIDKYVQSFSDYPTEGEYIDYAYSRDRVLALTVEISADKQPSPASLGSILENVYRGTLAFLAGVSTYGGAPGEKRLLERETEIHLGSPDNSALRHGVRLE